MGSGRRAAALRLGGARRGAGREERPGKPSLPPHGAGRPVRQRSGKQGQTDVPGRALADRAPQTGFPRAPSCLPGRVHRNPHSPANSKELNKMYLKGWAGASMMGDFRSIYFSQHSHTLGKEQEKWTQFMGSSYTPLPGTRRQRKTNTTPICKSVVWCTFCITVTVAPYRIDLYHTFEKETLENRHTFCWSSVPKHY